MDDEPLCRACQRVVGRASNGIEQLPADFPAVERNTAARLRRYDLTPEGFTVLLRRQGGVCAICRRNARLVIDHDHTTGEVRGLLCSPCNSGIGMLGDDAQTLRAAAHYLDRRR